MRIIFVYEEFEDNIESGANMQCKSYLPGYYYLVDHNVGASGSSWQLLNSVNYESGMAYKALLEPHSSYLFSKEILKQTILKHEVVFRNQVQELHLLYTRQKELMDEAKMRELSTSNLKMQTSGSNFFLSQMQCNNSQKALQSAQGVANIQVPSNFVSKKTIQGGDIYVEGNILVEDRVSPHKRNFPRKKLLDLQLPAEEYLDREEGEGFEVETSSQVPQVEYESPKSMSESRPKLNLKPYDGLSSNFGSSCSKKRYMFDLNEPIELDESVPPNSASFVGSNSSSLDFMHQEDQDLSGKSTSKSRVLKEEITTYIQEKKGNEESNLIPYSTKSLLSCKDRSNVCSQFMKMDNELVVNNHQSPFACITNSCSPVPFPDKVQTDASNSVSLKQTSSWDSKLIPICLPEFLQCSRSSELNSGTKRKHSQLVKVPPGSQSSGSIKTCRTSECRNGNAAKDHSVFMSSNDSKHGKSFEDVDLNAMPQCYSPVSEQTTKSTVVENSFEDPQRQLEKSTIESDYEELSRDGAILDFEKARAISSSLASNSSQESDTCCKEEVLVLMGKRGEMLSQSEHSIPIAAMQMNNKMAIGTDLEAPIRPKNEEQSQLIEESHDYLAGIPDLLSIQKNGQPNIDLDRNAAETIISMSLQRVEKCVKMASCDSLDWFAGIVSSVHGNLENKLRKLLNDVGCTLMLNQRKNSQARKAKHRKRMSWPSSCVVKQKNLEHINKLTTVADCSTLATVTIQKNVPRNHRARGNKQCKALQSYQMKRRLSSLLKQHSKKSECKSILTCFLRWGKKNIRQKGRPARDINQLNLKMPWAF